MSEKNGSDHYDVLHIRPETLDGPRSAPPAAIEQALRTPALVVETATNVYEGLARLAETDGPKPRAVVVSVDGLSRTEMEFFELAYRACRDLVVYVYGAGRAESRLAEAIEYGATGRATPELLESLVPEAEPPKHESDADGPPPKRSEPLEMRDEVSEPWEAEDDLEPPDGGQDEEDGRETAEEAPVRVPWLRYPDRPARAAPRRTPPQESRPEPPPRAKPLPPPAHTPLLTDEELQALIGDDIASLAPHRSVNDDEPDRANEDNST